MNGNLVVELWHSDMHYDDVVSLKKRQSEDRRIKVNCRYLVDLRNAIIIDLTDEQLRKLATQLFAEVPGHCARKIALLCSENRNFKQAQVYELKMSKFGASIITFMSLEVACTWLNVESQICHEAISQLTDNYEMQQAGIPPQQDIIQAA
jgi:hypothetical protein